mmetsp:Transcript_12440/g.36986  ORF Transcript_12440/g.36986 Transcript_12440/m.36986 type:complete len:264 (+) Transcript_12440:2417-3208(+)
MRREARYTWLWPSNVIGLRDATIEPSSMQNCSFFLALEYRSQGSTGRRPSQTPTGNVATLQPWSSKRFLSSVCMGNSWKRQKDAYAISNSDSSRGRVMMNSTLAGAYFTPSTCATRTKRPSRSPRSENRTSHRKRPRATGVGSRVTCLWKDRVELRYAGRSSRLTNCTGSPPIVSSSEKSKTFCVPCRTTSFGKMPRMPARCQDWLMLAGGPAEDSVGRSYGVCGHCSHLTTELVLPCGSSAPKATQQFILQPPCSFRKVSAL